MRGKRRRWDEGHGSGMLDGVAVGCLDVSPYSRIMLRSTGGIKLCLVIPPDNFKLSHPFSFGSCVGQTRRLLFVTHCYCC